MKHKHFTLIVFFLLFVCTFAVPQARRIEAKKKGQEDDSFTSTKLEIAFNVGHESVICSVAYSPDGKYVASGSFDNTIKLWEVESKRVLRTLVGHTSYVRSVTYSPDCKCVASASLDNTIKIWNVATGECIKTLNFTRRMPNVVVYSPDGMYLSSCFHRESTIDIFKVDTGKLKTTLNGHTNDVKCIAYSPNGKYLASISKDKTIKIWELGKKKCIKTLNLDEDDAIFISYSVDGKYLISDSKGKTFKLWEVVTGKYVKMLQADEVYSIAFKPDRIKTIPDYMSWGVEDVKSVVYSPDGKYFVNTFHDGIKLCETSTGNLINTFNGHTHLIKSVIYSPNGKYVASASWDKTIKIWKVESGKCIKTLCWTYRQSYIY